MAKSLLWYGPTGSFKSTQLVFISRYVYEKYGKITRVLYTGASDGGATTPEEQAGIMQTFRLGLRENPLPMLRTFARGYWPRAVEVGGLRKIQMEAPTADTWRKVGAVFLDSLSMATDEAMRDTVDKGKAMAQEVVTPFKESIEIVDAQGKVTSREEQFAAPAKAHYGFGQNFGRGVINAMSSLPCELVGFTTMEKRAEEEDASGRTTVYGPEMPGKALTPVIGGLVGDLIHFDQYFVPTAGPDKDSTGKPIMILLPQTKAYFVRHKDPKTGIEFPAKPRLHVSQVAKLMERFPGGYFTPTQTEGMDVYLKFLDGLESGATDAAKAWREALDEKLGRNRPKPVAAASIVK